MEVAGGRPRDYAPRQGRRGKFQYCCEAEAFGPPKCHSKMQRNARNYFFAGLNLSTGSCRIGASDAVLCDHLVQITLMMLDRNALRTRLP
ncbi:hypothetical protein SAMN02787142_7890 [Burkholderia sp. WP9]|uniref:hypothetical protein n=1 Tax=Burkholderia sp. WP9 TaxID=1500263 RepID=UPI0008988321|nr:hypothetical protein [Burkholderia sp. WP9]SEF12693.1 hypothetical protein SAMN02787142_7890 [Burkholderia sp. WP9]